MQHNFCCVAEVQEHDKNKPNKTHTPQPTLPTHESYPIVPRQMKEQCKSTAQLKFSDFLVT